MTTLDAAGIDAEFKTLNATRGGLSSTEAATRIAKFGRNAMVNLGNMSLIDYLFTDQQPPESVMKIIDKYDVQLELC